MAPEDVRHPAFVSIMLEFLPQQILAHLLLLVLSLSTFCLPPLKGSLFSRRSPPLLLLHGSYKLYLCKQNSKSLQHHVTNGRESTIILNEQHSDTEQTSFYFVFIIQGTDFLSSVGSIVHCDLRVPCHTVALLRVQCLVHFSTLIC